MIHQAIGRGALQFSQETAESYRAETIVNMTDILVKLLPRSPHEAISETALRIIDKAIYLKKIMTEEQALYHCFWIDYGDEYNEHYIEVTNEEQAGRMLMCTFPGLARIIKKDSEVLDVVIVKARAMLESDFEMEE